MPRKIVRCPYAGHLFQVEIKEGYVTARAFTADKKPEQATGHSQTCPICNRPLFIQYNP